MKTEKHFFRKEKGDIRMKVNNYYPNVQTTEYANRAAATSKAAQEQNKNTAAVEEKKPANTDRVELSSDAKVTTKMSDSERAALVQSLKNDLNNQMTRFTNMMTQMFHKQGITGMAAQGDGLWKTIASGNFTVDAKTKAEAQQAISEDGFWGVKQTSERIFSFAQALAGDDPEKMKQMQAAVEKGFQQATKAWGGALPSICDQTHSAINNMFDNYYKNAGKAE